MEIKETKELLAGIELISVKAGEILKDGIDASDLPKLLELLSNFSVIIEAVKGITEIDDELKELSEQEAIELGLAAYTMIKNIIAAFKKAE